jgi:hypothetical protein
MTLKDDYDVGELLDVDGKVTDSGSSRFQAISLTRPPSKDVPGGHLELLASSSVDVLL